MVQPFKTQPYIIYIELYKNGLDNQDNHNGVVTHLELDILECEVRWALESITISTASLSDWIPAELFKILKVDSVKVLHSMSANLENPAVAPRTGKCQFSSQFQRRAVLKIVPTIRQFCSLPKLARLHSTFFKLDFRSLWIRNFQMYSWV